MGLLSLYVVLRRSSHIPVHCLCTFGHAYISLKLNLVSLLPTCVLKSSSFILDWCQLQLCPPCNTLRSGHDCICNRVRGYDMHLACKKKWRTCSVDQGRLIYCKDGFARGRTQLQMQMCPGGHNCIMQQRPGGHDCICKTVRRTLLHTQ